MSDDPLQVAWAKSSPDGWLSLLQHCDDAAAVAALLWDNWVPPAVRKRVAEDLGGDADGARSLAVWLAAVHDLGKLSPAFAVQVPRLAEPMRRAGLDMPPALPERRRVPHGVAGQVALTEWLRTEHGWGRVAAQAVGSVVGGHHGVPPPDRQVNEARRRRDLLGGGAWQAAREQLLRERAAAAGLADRLADLGRHPLSRPSQVLLTAFVIVADWLASNETLFPYTPSTGGEWRVQRAWRLLALPEPWTPDRPNEPQRLLTERFGFPAESVRPVQRRAVELAATVDEPGLLVIEAPMGVGKTEAALAAAEVLAARSGAGGCFVALPTMATSDAMFGRVHRWIDRLAGPAAPATGWSTHLAHGKARLNEDFTGLLRVGAVSGVGDDGAAGRSRDGEAAVAHEWLVGRKKGVLATFVVGTIDQVLVGALQTRHLALRHLALAGKVVVIDEVHAADSYMAVYLERALEWLGAYGVPTVLLSATLPAAQRRQYVDAYLGHCAERSDSRVQTSSLYGDIGYPVIVATSGDDVRVEPVEAAGRQTSISVERCDEDDDHLVAAISEALVEGGTAAVLRNTVRRAQEAAELLRARISDVPVVLAHSRFVALDRAEREAQLRGWLGPDARGGTGRPECLVVVGTQVLEQSLDIDVDLMVTDLAPVDLVLQRVGRLHRHQRGVGESERPPRLRAPRLLVTGVTDWSVGTPQFDRGSLRVYGESALLRSLAVLTPHLDGAPLRLPRDIAPLVQAAYGKQCPVPPEWEERARAADDEADAHRADQRKRAHDFLLGRPGTRGSLTGWLSVLVDEETPTGQAQVRDSEQGVEAVVVQRVEDEVRLLPWVVTAGGAVLTTDDAPPDELARVAAACTLRLPQSVTRAGGSARARTALEDTSFPAWQQSRWLRGQLVLVLDEHLTAELAGRHLRYDRDLGLVDTKAAA